MGNPQFCLARPLIVGSFLVVTLHLFALNPALYTFAIQSASRKPVVTIDGKKEPYNIPAWIAWQSFFRRIVFLKQKEADAPFVELGGKTGIELSEIENIISEALQVEERVKMLDARAKSEVMSGKADKEKLRQMDLELQHLILEHRDRLARTLQGARFEKILLYIERFVAPNIVVGEFKD